MSLLQPNILSRLRNAERIACGIRRSELVNNLKRDFNVIHRRANVAKYPIHYLKSIVITNWATKLANSGGSDAYGVYQHSNDE